MSGGGGSGSDGGGDMQVSGAEAAYSTEKGISTHADTRVSQASFSRDGADHSGGQIDHVVHGGPPGTPPTIVTSNVGYGEGEVDPGLAKSVLGPDTSTVGIAADRDDYSSLDQEGQAEADKAKAISQGTLEVVTDKEGQPVLNEDGSVKTKPGRYETNIETGELERRDLTFAEHWANAPDALKYSPTLRLLWATGANLGEWSKRQGANVWDWGSGESNISPAPDRGDGQGATGTVSAAQSNFITSGQITPSNSVAANWYQSLGSSTASGNASAFNLASEYAAAKTKVKQTLGTPSAVGMLAVNDSPFFDFLQKHNLTKGIL